MLLKTGGAHFKKTLCWLNDGEFQGGGGTLPLVANAKDLAEPVGRYALRFTWNDGHMHGIYSWDYLRDVCPCQECRVRRESEKVAANKRE